MFASIYTEANLERSTYTRNRRAVEYKRGPTYFQYLTCFCGKARAVSSLAYIIFPQWFATFATYREKAALKVMYHKSSIIYVISRVTENYINYLYYVVSKAINYSSRFVAMKIYRYTEIIIRLSIDRRIYLYSLLLSMKERCFVQRAELMTIQIDHRFLNTIIFVSIERERVRQ